GAGGMVRVMEAGGESVVKRILPALALMIDFERDVKQQVQDVVSGHAKDDENAVSIFHALMEDENLPPAERTLSRLIDEGQLVVGAGTETTAKTLTTITFYLLNQPDTLRTLKEELRQAVSNPWDLPTWAQLERLPFLTAV